MGIRGGVFGLATFAIVAACNAADSTPAPVATAPDQALSGTTHTPAACANQTFMTSGGCVAWSTCPAGAVIVEEGTPTRDRVCGVTTTTGCPAGTAESGASCVACEPGTSCPGGASPKVGCSADTWDRDGAPATPCIAKTTCAAGTRVVDVGSATTDRTCEACDAGTFSASENQASCQAWADCAPGTYGTVATASSDRVCTGCAPGSFSGEANAASCAAWSTCAAGTYVSTAPSTTNDRACTTCADGTFTNAPNLSLCLPAGACAPGTVQTVPAGPQTPPVCQACAAGSECLGGATPAVACGGSTWDDDGNPATPCVAKTTCAPGTRVAAAGTATTDRACAPCTNSYSTTSNATSCTAYSTCAAGQYVSQAPSTTSNRMCTACDAGAFSTASNAASCSPFSTCPAGTYVTAAGTAQSNRTCASCPAGQTTADINQTVCTAITTTPVAGASGCAALLRRDRTFSGNRLADEYQWADATCGARTAALVRVDRKGGHALEFSYPVAGVKRTVGISGEGGFTETGEYVVAGGFGYVVSHLYDASIATRNGWDDSPLGSPLCKDDVDPAHDYSYQPSCATGYTALFQGRHHAIHQFTLNYPRWGRSNNADVRYNMPVTIQWMFHTGMDAMVYAITFDLSSAPSSAVVADIRAPYGSMNFDGIAAGTYGGAIGGVSWADSKKFDSLATAGLTMNSPWTWTDANTGPAYNLLWTSSTDAEIGSIATNVISQMEAGGYSYLGTGRGQSSADGTRCNANDGYGAGGHTMPCAPNWSFQSVNYGFFDQAGNATPASTTNSKRFAWGTDWGVLGKPSVTTQNGNTVKGWPRVSYSVFIALDAHTKAPSKSVAAQVEVIDHTVLTAVTGAVRTSGLAGAGRTDSITYNPIGYSPTYSTWEVDASANSISLGLDVNAAGALDHPTFVVHGWSSASAPSQVVLDGTVLTADQGYYASLRPGSQELWLTLNYKISGTGHHIVAN